MSGPPGGACPPAGDAAAEVQDLENRLGALLGASGVFLVCCPPVPAPRGLRRAIMTRMGRSGSSES